MGSAIYMDIAPAIDSSFELSPFRAIELFFSLTRFYIMLLQSISLRYERFLALRGLSERAFREVLSCLSVR